jgi:ornithine cyclodeaminase/alanine dehydrogenase-like protein (mu-crystallin family)
MGLHRERTHPQYVDGCFGCKASTLTYQDLHIRAWSHSNDRELDAYRTARKQGIQPKTTKLKDINAAVRASDVLGRAVKA